MAIAFSTLQQRYLDLIGDSDGTIDDFGKRNINHAIQDILNKYQFSWNIATSSTGLSSGVLSLPSDYNPIWGLTDVRVLNSSVGDDDVFTNVPIRDRDRYTSSDHVYWITYNTATSAYVINSKSDADYLTYYYNFIPGDLTNDTDICVVPDVEAVSYLAASKNWIGSERDTELKKEYEQMADRYIQALWFRDLANGPVYNQGSIVEMNPELTSGTSINTGLIVEIT